MKFTLSIFILLLFIKPIFSQIELNLEDGQSFKIKKIIDYDSSEEKYHKNNDIEMLVTKFFFTQSYNDFLNLFVANSNTLSKKDFENWRTSFKPVNLRTEAIYFYNRKAVDYAEVLYVSELQGFYDRASLTLKKVGNKWYIGDYNDNNQVMQISSFLRRVKPDFFNSRNKQNYSLSTIEAELSSDETLEYNLSERIDPQQYFNEDRSNDNQFIVYMDSLNINSVDKQRAIELIQKLEYSEAASLLSDVLGNEVHMLGISRRIAEIYGPNRIFFHSSSDTTKIE